MSKHYTYIDSSRPFFKLNLRELYRYKELLWSLALRDIKVKYAQTFIGFLWAVINPLLTLVILHFVFGKVAQVETNGIPHILFTMTGIVCWTYFSTLVSESGNSIMANQNMIKKIYFPRLAIPFSKAVSGLLDFAISFLILMVIMVIYGYSPSSNIVYSPLFLILIMLFGLAGGVWISALTVRYRDFKFVTPFLLQLGLFVSPIAYSVNSVPEKYQLLYKLNPLVGIIEGFRWSLFSEMAISNYVIYSVIFVFVFLLSGLFYFKRVEYIMSDIL